jgi:hypothetical protein
MHCTTLFSFYLLVFVNVALSSPIVPGNTLLPHVLNKRAKSNSMRTVGYFGNWVTYYASKVLPYNVLTIV